jgi:hypothetical protein
VGAVAIDTYAATNPALCSLALRAFAEGYAESNPDGLPLPLIILPLPIVLTEQIAATIDSTNVTTGLLPWIVRNQEITIGLWDKVARTSVFSRQALLFGIRYRIINMTADGRLLPDKTGLARQPTFPASTEPGRAIRFAKRLGIWMGEVREMDTIFISLGINR